MDLQQLFTLADITEEVKGLLPKIPAMVKEFMDIVAKQTEPLVYPGRRCEEPYGCEFEEYCWKVLPKGSVYELAGWKGISESLYSRGIIQIKDIPAEVKLSDAQKDQVNVIRSGNPLWRAREIKKFLAEIEYPLYFLGFEAFMQAVPPFDDTKTYEHIPFQYSIHRMDAPEKEPVHLEYLASGNGDPRAELCEKLLADLGSRGTVFSYSAYEIRILNALVELFPQESKSLQKVVDRVIDLATPFRSRMVVHSEFKGSYSIKKVFPALVPGKGYDELEVGEGMAAVAAFKRLQDPALPSVEREQIRKSLLDYCAQDTVAMVKLLDILNEEHQHG